MFHSDIHVPSTNCFVGMVPKLRSGTMPLDFVAGPHISPQEMQCSIYFADSFIYILTPFEVLTNYAT